MYCFLERSLAKTKNKHIAKQQHLSWNTWDNINKGLNSRGSNCIVVCISDGRHVLTLVGSVEWTAQIYFLYKNILWVVLQCILANVIKRQACCHSSGGEENWVMQFHLEKNLALRHISLCLYVFLQTVMLIMINVTRERAYSCQIRRRWWVTLLWWWWRWWDCDCIWAIIIFLYLALTQFSLQWDLVHVRSDGPNHNKL